MQGAVSIGSFDGERRHSGAARSRPIEEGRVRARRTKSVKPFSGVDEAAVDAVVELLANSPNPDNPPGNKAVLNHVRETLGLSLTTRELERVVKAAGKIDMADERLNRRSEGDYL